MKTRFIRKGMKPAFMVKTLTAGYTNTHWMHWSTLTNDIIKTP
jgi:hypothetical protein